MVDAVKDILHQVQIFQLDVIDPLLTDAVLLLINVERIVPVLDVSTMMQV